MGDRHEIPTHLGVEDRLMFGLTVRQLLWIGGGIALGYTLWQHLGPAPRGRAQLVVHASLSSPVPAPVRLLLAAVPLVVAIFLALYRQRGRTAEEWLFAWLHYCVMPKRVVWRLPSVRSIAELAVVDADLLVLAGQTTPPSWPDAANGVAEMAGTAGVADYVRGMGGVGSVGGMGSRPQPASRVGILGEPTSDGALVSGRLSPVAPPASLALAELGTLLAMAGAHTKPATPATPAALGPAPARFPAPFSLSAPLPLAPIGPDGRLATAAPSSAHTAALATPGMGAERVVGAVGAARAMQVLGPSSSQRDA